MLSTRLSRRTGRHEPRRSRTASGTGRQSAAPHSVRRGAGRAAHQVPPGVRAPAGRFANQPVRTNRSAVIPQLGAHGRSVEEYRAAPCTQRHLDASIAAPDLESSLDACGAIRSQAGSRRVNQTSKPSSRLPQGSRARVGLRRCPESATAPPLGRRPRGNQQDERGAALLSTGPAGCHQSFERARVPTRRVRTLRARWRAQCVRVPSSVTARTSRISGERRR